MAKPIPMSFGPISIDTVTFGQGHGVIRPGTVVGKVAATGLHIPCLGEETPGLEGAEFVAGVALDDPDTTDGDVSARITARLAEWRLENLTFDESVTTEDEFYQGKLQQLADRFIVLR